jgi:hypothetical protein
MQAIRQQENIFLNLRLGSIDDEFVDIDSRLASLFKSPKSIYRKAWINGELNNFLIADFRNHVDNLISADFLLVKK